MTIIVRLQSLGNRFGKGGGMNRPGARDSEDVFRRRWRRRCLAVALCASLLVLPQSTWGQLPEIVPPSVDQPSSTPWPGLDPPNVDSPLLTVPDVPLPADITASPLREGINLQDFGTDSPWSWQILPRGLVYRSYLAGVKESRFASAWMREDTLGWIWDISLGGRMGMLRYGSSDALRPEGWQLDIEGAAMPRLDLEHQNDLVLADFRFGIPLTYGSQNFQTKLAFYHLSSHVGDEYLVRYQTLSRINYSRDVVVWGNSWYLTSATRLYGEVGYAYYFDGGSKPWEFQFGVDYSPMRLGASGAPFLAMNGHLRQEIDFGGNFVVQTGWQWRGDAGQLFRMGLEYFTGSSDQFQVYTRQEKKLGLGLWYDF